MQVKGKMMEISIIVPFHRGKQYLKDCLESICDQSFNSFETILVLDHIEEEIEDLLERFSDTAALRVFRLDGKRGTAAARNLGLQNARGNYICFLDSDDYLLEDSLFYWVRTAKWKKADITVGKIERTWYKRRSFLEEYSGSVKDPIEDDKRESESKPDSEFRIDSEFKRDSESQSQVVSQLKGDRNDTASREELIEHCFKEEASVLGMLFSREFLERFRFTFPEKLKVFSDIPFLTGTLRAMEHFAVSEEGIYVKRYHNDPIQLPSLSQTEIPDRHIQYVNSFLMALKEGEGDGCLKKTLEMEFFHYFINLYQKRFLPKPGQLLPGRQFKTVCAAMKQCDRELLKHYERKQRKLLEGFFLEKEKRCILYGTLSMGLSKFKKSQTKQTAIYRMIDRFIFKKLPIKENWIVFESYLGKNYSDSCKYIYRYLDENFGNQYKYIWAVKDKQKEIEGSAVKVKHMGLLHFYYASRAKYWVNNMRQPIWREKRRGQVFLETWHGTPLKRLVFDMEDVHSATATYKSDFYKQSRQWDYLLSDNPFSTEVFESAFLFPREKMLEHGYPRNDILHWENKDVIGGRIRKKLGIPEGKKTILYAPTWRDDEYYGPGQYKFNLALDLNQMKEALSDEYVILLRTHYFIADQLDTSEYEGFAYNVSRYDDVSELYLISDICITDYSSVFFDYANLKRPLLFYTYDLEKYRDVLRGFYIDMEEEVPGPLLYTTEEVIEAICHIDQVEEVFRERYERFYQKFCCWDDGYASKRIVKDVFGVSYEEKNSNMD